MPIVEAINIYPIKSLGGISLSNVSALEEGFEDDRRFMLVDENGKFLTQREKKELALFSCQIIDNELVVSYKSDELLIPKQTVAERQMDVNIWSSKLKAEMISTAFSEWFSNRLNAKCYLVKMPNSIAREKIFLKPPFKTKVSFADGYPYLILSKESLKLLNSKLDEPVSIDRFRANIIVSGCKAHEEDSWKEFQIGTAGFKNIKPCARCTVITIDQRTGIKSKEPLLSLNNYRKKGNKIYFGSNAILTSNGAISIGDDVTLLS